MKKFVLVDAETDGLYGDFLTVAMKAVDETGKVIERGYWGVKKAILSVKEPWVKDNVVPILGDYEDCESEEVLLQRVWDFWMRHREEACVVADVPYPVECRLFQKCVEQNPEERTFLAPFPLLDLASMLYVKGIDPLTARRELLPKSEADSGMMHNASFDVDMTETILRMVLKG